MNSSIETDEITGLIKSKQKNRLSMYKFEQKLLLRSLECFPYTIEEAASIFRMNRSKFFGLYIETGLIKLTVMEDNSKKILYGEIKKHLEERQRVFSQQLKEDAA